MDNGASPEKKNPVEQVFDVFVYAPLGLALEARALMPKLVERGRNQVMMARMIGKFAVRQGQTETSKVLGKAGDQATAVLSDLGLLGRDGNGAAAAPPSRASAPPVVTPPAAADAVAVARPTDDSALDDSAVDDSAVADSAVADPAVDDSAVELAIADFDSLAASQVIPRLPGLSKAELEAVRSYEERHRGRKTVLNRIAQLQAT